MSTLQGINSIPASLCSGAEFNTKLRSWARSWPHLSMTDVSSKFSFPQPEKLLLVEEVSRLSFILQPNVGDVPYTVTQPQGLQFPEPLPLKSQVPFGENLISTDVWIEEISRGCGPGSYITDRGWTLCRGHRACTSGGWERTHRKLERASLRHHLESNHWYFCRVFPITTLGSQNGGLNNFSMLSHLRTQL